MAVALEQARADVEQLRLDLDRAQISALLAFSALLEKWNRHFNLLSRQDIDRVWPRHILDSLSICDLLLGDRVLDLGTGGGFPGLPLAIAAPEREFLLVDRHQRKCRFLEQAAGELGLANVRVHCGDVAELTTSTASVPSFSTITSRAVAPAEEIWALVQSLLDERGRLIVMAHTRSSDIELPKLARRVKRRIPGLGQDHEVVIIDRNETDG